MNKRPPKNGEIREEIQNTLLVDGNALFKRGFSGAKGLYNKDALVKEHGLSPPSLL